MPIVLAYAEPPAAVTPAPPASGITQPRWLRLPNAADLAQYYPVEAAKNRVEGRSTIRCRVNSDGRLIDCEVESEEPADAGFGTAALNLAVHSFKMRPKTQGGSSVAGGTVRIPIRFALPPLAEGADITAATTDAPTLGGARAVTWLSKPGAEDMAQAMPEVAARRAIDGRIVLFCTVAPDGRFATCRVVTEEPADMGFGAAALRIAGKFRMALAASDGTPVAGGTIKIPIRFLVGKR